MYRGHETYEDADGVWRYQDGVAVFEDRDRPCGKCGLANTPEGHDGCLGTLPGVMNACCGHGEADEAYVQFLDGTVIRGCEALAYMDKHRSPVNLCECGKPRRKGGRQCAACYMRAYRKTTKGSIATKAAHKRWRSRHAHYWDREYKREYRRRTHFLLHADVKALQKAVRRLEDALAEASQHQGVCGTD